MAFLQRRMEQTHFRDRAPACSPTQHSHCRFDFGELGHANIPRETLTALVRLTQNAPMHAPTQSDVVVRTSPEARSAGVRRAILLVLVLNALSAALKLGVGARTGALTVLGAALESGLDMMSNVVAMFAIAVAARAPDDDHP